jgi:glycosyltransferase involved in cell wall biosynthesis
MEKPVLLLQSDYACAKTGFGRNTKAILEWLYKRGNVELVNYVVGIGHSHPDLQRTPWKTIGCLPDDPAELAELNKDPNVARQAGYGAHLLDKVIHEYKPDVYLAVQDIWGVDFAIGRKWFNKIHSVIWTTLDSLPILPSAIEAAKKTKNYWVWSSFAEKALKEEGFNQVETVHGAVDDASFKRLSEHARKELRNKFSIPLDAFVVGFVFRNQLRKSVPNLLEGYRDFKKQNPTVNARLLLHTHFGEGWKIPKLCKEYGIDEKEVLTTYVCKNCLGHSVENFSGQDIRCSSCGDEKGKITTQPGIGVSEEQLNDVYNLMDVYAHPFTSGGQEIPIQEAKLTELITLVTNYSCGEEMCCPEANSLPLEYAEYREHETEFIKASTYPSSIAKQLKKVFDMKPEKAREMGRNARQWVLDNFSISVIGKRIEDFILSREPHSYDFKNEEELREPFYEIPEIEDRSEWLKSLYKNILKMDVEDKDGGLDYWKKEMDKGMDKKTVLEYFRNVAIKENQTIQKQDFADLLDKDDEGKRICFVLPQAIGDLFMTTSLFLSLKEQYPDHNLYVATDPGNFEVMEGNPHVHKLIPYMPQMENLLWLEGNGNHKGYFEIAFLPHVGTQKMFDYQHNGVDKIAFDLG